MLGYFRRLRRWWRIRRMTEIRNGLLRYGNPNNPTTRWQIEAIGKAIEQAKEETH